MPTPTEGGGEQEAIAFESVHAIIYDRDGKHRDLEQLFPEGTRIIELDELTVGPDDFFDLQENTAYIVRGPIHIEGTIRTTVPEGSIDGPSISLYSTHSIWFAGEIAVADGRDGFWPGERGGDGGSISLGAPWVAMSQEFLIGGYAGEAGPAGDGGNGGDVNVYGVAYRYGHREGQDVLTAIGGDGSRGADGDYELGLDFVHGGHGGNGGNARFLRATQSEVLSLMMSRARDDGEPGDPGADGPPGADGSDGVTPGKCLDGTNAKNGNESFGGKGWPGGDGDDAELILNPDGSVGAISPAGDGGNGGNGGHAIAGDGGNGGNGGPCCGMFPGVGGDGGLGMSGGIAAAGNAGIGGNGGNGLAGGMVDGGRGGHGGVGGSAAGGNGGTGGNGGDGFPVGGDGADGGSSGDSSFGFGGAGGIAGLFAPPLSDGDLGDDGTGFTANFGGAGDDGDPCYMGS